MKKVHGRHWCKFCHKKNENEEDENFLLHFFNTVLHFFKQYIKPNKDPLLIICRSVKKSRKLVLDTSQVMKKYEKTASYFETDFNYASDTHRSNSKL